MKVAYILESEDAASYKLQSMILPQLEEGIHGAEIELMFFFDENCHTLRNGNEVGSKLSQLAEEKNIILILCDQCADQRGLAEQKDGEFKPRNTFSNVQVGCFPDLYRMVREREVDQVVTI